ncbi:MAG: hypothetical protein J6K98_00915, partial [Clostridia bacterium]|nr:hypothetical protein [Clostridia bacterium]
MDKRLWDCLNGQEDSYIFPFLWLHGESRAQLSRELDAIQQSGIREFCAESRPYEAFCQDAWWEDFGFLLREAQARDMRVWLLDDKHFPTGIANGYFREHPRKRPYPMLREIHMDVSGPRPGAAFTAVGGIDPQKERLYTVLAYRRLDDGFVLTGEAVELTPTLCDDMVYFDVPEGVWRVFFLIETDSPPPKPYYIDMLDPDSCRVLLDEIYEPHYAHFAEYFGNTFAGFFSDEPSFANDCGSYDSKLGKRDMWVPWREDLPALIAREAGVSEDTIRRLLPALWFDVQGQTALIRSYYMEVVTKLYSENFCWQIGNWCRAHGVEYIGHVIEDMNTHMRLGYGSGHYFRALDGQDMAGIDVVLHQILPGIQEMMTEGPVCEFVADPEFFLYTLGKLGSSHAHIQPLKKGRAMCEMFGAYGWAEGLPLMKQLTDHMLVSGINRFVPHAFTPKYPDADCPPHFYAGGHNPQFPWFKELMGYMGRLSHLLSGGVHQASVAVFYNAEGEWSGGRNMLFQKLAKVLTQHQIDFDFVPADVLSVEAIKGSKCHLNGETYACLLVSGSEILPRPLIERFCALRKRGLPVIFADYMPEKTSEGDDIDLAAQGMEIVPLAEIPAWLRRRGFYEITVEGKHPYLRFFHTRRGDADVYMFYNEDVHHPLDTYIQLPQSGDCLVYAPWENRVYRDVVGERGWHCRLEGGEAMVLCLDKMDVTALAAWDHRPWQYTEPLMAWGVEIQAHGENGWQRLESGVTALASVTARPGLTRFAGKIRYTSTLSVKETGGTWQLDLGT